MSKDEITLIAAIITAGTALFVFVILHFFVEPLKERRKRRVERFTNFVAPLYAIIVARCKVGKITLEGAIASENETLAEFRNSMLMGTVGKGGGDDDFISRKAMEKFIFEKIGYATLDVSLAWSEYVASHGVNKGVVEQQYVDQLIMAVVKEYHESAKKLGLPYNKKEMKTGIPNIYADLR